MKHMMFVAALSFAVFGCKKGGAGGGDCDSAIAHSMELSKAEMSKMPGMDDAMLAKMKDVGISHCKNDKWPAEAVSCMNDAKAMADAQTCYGKLTQDQRDKMQKAAMDLATQSMKAAPPPPPPPPTPAPAGSDMGSAAGSAGSAK